MKKRTRNKQTRFKVGASVRVKMAGQMCGCIGKIVLIDEDSQYSIQVLFEGDQESRWFRASELELIKEKCE